MTLSLKKTMEKYASTTSPSEVKVINTLYSQWVEDSRKQRVSWCYDKTTGWKGYEYQPLFQSEVKERIAKMYEDYQIRIVSKGKPTRTIRSKKKRIRKKYEKSLIN